MNNLYKQNNVSVEVDALKGQKIVAALYLITNHLSDTNPLKGAIRSEALALITRATPVATIVQRVADLIGAAVFAGMMSRQNGAIITAELDAFATASNGTSAVFGTLFSGERALPSSQKNMSVMSDRMSFKPKDNATPSNEAPNGKKLKRQHEILAFINEKKSVGIKDIARVFTDVSEKTIQRELGTLVQEGKITKRGSKRWSLYLAV